MNFVAKKKCQAKKQEEEEEEEDAGAEVFSCWLDFQKGAYKGVIERYISIIIIMRHSFSQPTKRAILPKNILT